MNVRCLPICMLASLIAAPTMACALDVDGFEALVQKRSENDRTVANIATLSLNTYFVGIAEMLTLQAVGSSEIYFGGKRTLCLPSKAKVSGPILQAMVETELRDPAFLKSTLGEEWRTYAVPAVLMIGLIRTYPCP